MTGGNRNGAAQGALRAWSGVFYRSTKQNTP